MRGVGQPGKGVERPSGDDLDDEEGGVGAQGQPQRSLPRPGHVVTQGVGVTGASRVGVGDVSILLRGHP